MKKKNKEKIGRKTKLTNYKQAFLLYDLFKRASSGLSDKELFKFSILFREIFVNGKKKPIKRGIKFKTSKQYNNEYYHKVKRKDPCFRLRISFSSSLNYHIKKKGRSVFDITERYLGYNMQDLIKHLESQFKDGMSLDNYGKWHIDHIIPASSFNYSSFNDKEFKECWKLSNLQPLWAIDNFKKGNRLIWLNQQ